MKVLITGSTGFIGCHLKERFSSRHDVLAPSHAELDLLDAALVEGYLRRHHVDVLLHAATWDATRNSAKDPARTLENNLRMFFNLARVNGAYGKMFYFGSGQEYGRSYCSPRMKEEQFDAHVPDDPYGLSKYIMTQHAMRADNIHNLRCFGVFGKHEDWQIRFISNACCKAVWDLPITIKQNVVFDYLDVDDLAGIVERLLVCTPREKVYNVCTGRTHELLTLARKVLEVAGKTLPVKVAVPGMGREYSGDPARLLCEFGPFTFTDMDESIRRLYGWYGAHKQDIDRELLLTDK